MAETTQAADVASWLRGVLDEEWARQERFAQQHYEDPYLGKACASIWSDNPNDCDCDIINRAQPGFADIAAKRSIVDECMHTVDRHTYSGDLARAILAHLASAYAHRDGYRSEWRA